ncbi:MAG: hypothetical protein V2B18_11700, partial [Pseudomonadota bacterium]
MPAETKRLRVTLCPLLLFGLVLGLLPFNPGSSAEEDKPIGPELTIEEVKGKLRFNDFLKLRISNLRDWVLKGNDTSKFKLCLNGKPLNGLDQPFCHGARPKGANEGPQKPDDEATGCKQGSR